MTPRPPPLATARVIRLLLGNAVRRWINRTAGQFGKLGRKKTGAPARAATPGKHRRNYIGAVFIVALFLFIGVNMAGGIVRNLARGVSDGTNQRVAVERLMHRRIVRAEEYLQGADSPAEKERHRTKLARQFAEDELGHPVTDDDFPLRSLADEQRIEVDRKLAVFDARGAAGFRSRDTDGPWLADHSDVAGSTQFRILVALVLCLSCLCSLLMSLGNANTDLGHVAWTTQWLFTFPVRARTLFLSRVIEYTVVNPASWIIHLAFLGVVLASVGFGGRAVPLALAGTIYINVLLAVSRLVIETWLRKRLPLERLKNIQAVCTAAGTLGMFLLYALSYSKLPFDLGAVASAVPAAVCWLPWSLPSLLLADLPAIGGAMLVVVASGLTLGGVRLAEHLVRDGLLLGAGTYSGTRGAATDSPSRFRGIVGRELILLVRDRNLLVQTLIVPLFVLAFQLVISPQLLAGAAADPRHAAALAFGIGVYVLMSGGFMALSNEGKALWLLYTFPQHIDGILLRKSVVWGTAAALYTLAAIIGVAVLRGGMTLGSALASAAALVGVAIFATISVGMGILGTDPLAEEVQRKIRPTVIYTYMLLAGLYGYGFYASLWTQLVLAIVCALLAVAIWQIVRDRVPLMLDPVQRPAPRIALSDGLIAVLAFVVLQSVAAVAAFKAGLPDMFAVLFAFVTSGALVSLFALVSFWRRKVPQILATIGIRAPHGARSSLASIGYGVALGAGAGSVGLVYQRLVIGPQDVPFNPVFAALAIVAAPLVEELIFRGLVFRGLRRSTRPLFAIVASAAIFAIVHPPMSFVPVFGLGLATALSFERTGRLLAPMCAHAVYNAIVVLTAMQW